MIWFLFILSYMLLHLAKVRFFYKRNKYYYELSELISFFVSNMYVFVNFFVILQTNNA